MSQLVAHSHFGPHVGLLQLFTRPNIFIAAWIFALLAANVCRANPIPAPQLVVPLTSSELAWLNTRPVLRLGVDKNGWAPIEVVGASGDLHGLTADILRQIEAMVPVRFEVVLLESFTAVLAAAQAGRIDAFASATPTEARRKTLNFTSIYLSNPVVTITRRDGKLDPTTDTQHLTLVVEEDTALDEALAKEAANWARVTKAPTTLAALKAVSAGQADVYIGPWLPITHATRQALITNLELRGFARHGDDDLAIALRKGLPPEALTTLNKAIQSIPEEFMHALKAPLLQQSAQLLENAQVLQLSDADRAFLTQNPVLRVAFDPAFAPFTGAAVGELPKGFAVDVLNHVSQKLATRIEWVRVRDFTEALEAVRNKQVDAVAAVAPTSERQAYMRFAGPFAVAPTAIVTAARAQVVLDLQGLAGQRIALPKGYFLRERIAHELPQSKIVECGLVPNCLALIDQGRADATIGNLNVVSQLIQSRYLGHLRVAGVLDDAPSRLYIGLRDDAPPLKTLVEKALATMDEPTRNNIMQRWLAVEYQVGLSWREVLRWTLPLAGLLLSIVGLSLWWARRLAREVTRREHAEAIMRIARDEAAAASQAKGTFLATMSHEVRTPMNGVIGMLDTLAVSSLSHEQAGLVRTARNSAQELLRLLTDVLDYSRLEANRLEVKPEPTAIRAVLESACLLFASNAHNKGVAISLVVEPSVARTLLIDPLRVRQIVSNLVGNAVKFTTRGSVRVTVRPQSGSEPHAQEQWLDIDIDDTGPGIAPADLELLFQPFVQASHPASDPAAGAGLGLAICQRLATLMRGNITAQSEVGQGSRFRFSLRANVVVADHTPRPYAGKAARIVGTVSEQLGAALAAALAHEGLVYGPSSATSVADAERGGADLIILEDASEPALAASALAGTLPTRAALLVVQATPYAGADVRGFRLASLSSTPLQASALRDALDILLAPQPEATFDGALTGRYKAVATSPDMRGAATLSTPILVVDDHPTNRAVLESQLRRLGYPVHAVQDGAGALAAWQASRHELVITDCRMPGLDGYELTRRIRADEVGGPRCAVIGLSADPPHTALPAARAAGMDDYLQKPVNLNLLAETLHRWTVSVAAATPAEAWFALSAFAAQVGGFAAARDLLPLFVDSLAEDRGNLLALKSGATSAEQLAGLAHRVKGAARTAGCSRLAALAQTIEKGLPAPEVDDEQMRLQHNIDQLIIAIDATRTEALQQLQA